MNRSGESRWILAFALASTLVPAIGARASEMPDDPLARDPRLSVKVTLAEKDRPLGELLAGLGHQVKVPLRASRDVADDKATLFLDERPAAEALALIARQFDFRWYRVREGYQLGQSIAGKGREAARREQEVQAQLAAIQAEMERRPPLESTPHPRLEEREKEIVQRLQSEEGDESERARLNEERSAIVDTLHPGRAPAVALFHGLTAAQVRELLAGRDLWLSSADGTMPPRIAALMHQSQLDAMKLSSWALLFTLLGRDAWPPPEAEVAVRLVNPVGEMEGPPPRGEPRLRLLFLVPIGREEGSRRLENITGWQAEGKPPESPVIATKTDAPDLMRTVKLDLSPHLPPTSQEETDARDRFPDREMWPRGLPTLGDLGEALHQSTGLEIAADSFVRARLSAEAAASLKGHSQPVVQLLDKIANEMDYTWRKEGNLLLFRSRHYYRDREEEVPERILRPFRQRVRRAAAATLDDLAGLAAALTDTQARGLHHCWGWYFEATPALPPNAGMGGFYGSRQHLRFWASLTPLQQQAVRNGVILPVSAMTRRQALAFVAALESRSGPVDLHRPPTLAEIATGGFGCPGELPITIDHTFAYYLAGEPTPALEINLEIRRP